MYRGRVIGQEMGVGVKEERATAINRIENSRRRLQVSGKRVEMRRGPL